MNEPDCIDSHALERLRDLGGPAFLRQMIGLFLELADKKLAEARTAEQAADLPALAQAIHPLRSSSGNVGAARLQELATRIERLAHDQKTELLSPLLRELEAAFVPVKARLEQERASIPP